MPIIDEEGRVFGTINVVDALAVVLILAVAVAGIALVTSSSETTGNIETQHVTLDFGSQPENVLAQLDAGDTMEVPNEPEQLRITETYFLPGESDTRVFAQVAVTGTETDGEFSYDDTPLRLGQPISFETEEYRINGTVKHVGENLTRSMADTLATAVVSESTAQAIETGDAYLADEEPIATVESVAVYGTNETDRKRVYVGLSTQTVTLGGQQLLGTDRPLRLGTQLPFRTESYEFTGEVVRLGTATEPGEPAQRTVELELETVPPNRANSVETGLTETNAGETVAEVTDVDVRPATIVLESEDGNIYEREHPVNKTVTLTAELQVRELDTGVRFKGRTIQEGNTVVLDLGTTTIRAEVVDLDPE